MPERVPGPAAGRPGLEQPRFAGPWQGIGVRIALALVLVGSVSLLAAFRTLCDAAEEVGRAERAIQQNDLADHLFQAVRHLGFERGRVNVVLGHAGPLEEMAENRAFVARQRALAEDALDLALAHFPGPPRAAGDPVARVELERAALGRLRAAADREMLLPKAQRTAALPGRWFAAATDLIDATLALLARGTLRDREGDGVSARLGLLKLRTLALRNAAGPEISILSATMLGGGPLPAERHAEILGRRAEAALLQREVLALAEGLEDPALSAPLARLRSAFQERLTPLRERALTEALAGGPYSVRQAELQAAGVEMLEAVSGMMDATLEATRRHLLASKGAAERARWWAVGEVVLVAGLMAGAMARVHAKVTRPLSRSTSALRALAAGDLPPPVPAGTGRDEVSALGASVNVLRAAAIQQRSDAEARRRAEAGLHAAERLAATGRLARGVSHEINSPLACVVSSVAFARDQLAGEAPTPERRETLEALEDAAASAVRIRDLVKDLQHFADALPPDEEGHHTVADALRAAHALAAQELARCASVRSDVPDDLEAALPYADLVEVLAGLLANAGLATGSAPNDVVVAARREGGAAVLTVTDTGVGMDDATRARAFEPFFTTREVGAGRGLGLSVCHGIVLAAGGAVDLASAPGAGTSVTVRLPLRGAAGAAA